MIPIRPTSPVLSRVVHATGITFVLLAMFLNAWAGAEESGTPSRHVAFQSLSIEHGLSQSSVQAILQDRKGFMWFGTGDGLNRFDGYSFKTYSHRPFDSNSLPDSNVTALLEDESGTLWVGTDGGGLARFDPLTGRSSNLRHDPTDAHSLGSDRINALHQDGSGKIWVGTTGGGLNSFDRQRECFDRYRHAGANAANLMSDDINVIAEDSSGLLWVGTPAGLHRFDPATGRADPFRSPTSKSSDEDIRSLTFDFEGTLWVGTAAGLSQMGPGGSLGQAISGPGEPNDSANLAGVVVTAILEDRAGTIWVGGDGGGLTSLDRSGRIVEQFRHQYGDPRSLAIDRIVSLYEDATGIIWVGTIGGGLSRFHPARQVFAHYGPNRLPHPGVLAVYEDRAGVLWVGTWGGGLARLDRGAGNSRSFRFDPDDPTSLGAGPVVSIREDTAGGLWVATRGGGLNRYDRTTGRFRRYRHDRDDPSSLSHDTLNVIHVGRSGALWLGTRGGGLNRFDTQTGTFKRYQHDPLDPTSLSGNDIRAIHQARDGTLWLGAWNNGLSRFEEGSGTVRRYRHDPSTTGSLSQDDVRAIHEDDSGVLWLGTNGGLNRFDPETETFRRFTVEQGLSNNTVYGILPDRQGNLWLSTNAGLSSFDPARETFVNYDVSDGLQSNEFNNGAFFASPKGELFLGGINGLTAFWPEDIRVLRNVPSIAITSVRTSNGQQGPEDSEAVPELLELSYGDTFASFSFAVLDYYRPNKNEFAYRLEGLSDEWIALGTVHNLTLTNLEPGEFVLRVKGANADGYWNETGTTIRLNVLPPYWRTAWFRVSVFALFGAVLASLYATRTRALRARAQMLEAMNEQLEIRVDQRAQELELAQDRLLKQDRLSTLGRLTATVAHELRNPLATIANSVRVVEVKIPAHRFGLEKTLERIRRSITRCDRIIGELLSLTRGPVGPPVSTQLDAWLDETLDELTLPEGIAFRREFESPGVVVAIDPDRLRQAVVNVVVNAGQALEGGMQEVTVRTRTVRERAEILVLDTGPGIPEDVKDRIFEPLFSTKGFGVGLGLSIVEQIMKEHDGGIDIRDREVQGTEVRLWLPIGPSQTLLEETSDRS